ncbi:MAG: alpha/beta fold hydrolase [Polyangiaceae bacterium]
MTERATFVLVHGAFRAGWSFARLRPLLEAQGHRTFAPSLPGFGEHRATTVKDVSLAQWAESTARFIELEDLSRVILVGHSQGGLVIAAASQLCHARLSRLVFLDAPIARHGERAIDLQPKALQGMTPPALARDLWLPPKPMSASETLSAEDAAWINPRLGPTPIGPSLDPLVLEHPAALVLPRHHLFCRATPETFPCAHGRERLLREGTPFSSIEADHDAPITAPALVADALLAIARGEATPHA